MDFNTARNLGLAGSIVVLAGMALGVVLGGLGFILNLIGLILLLISLHFLSEVYGERRIFRDALISIAILVGGSFLILIFLALAFGLTFFMMPFRGPRFPGEGLEEQGLTAIIGIVVIAFILLMAILAVSAFFWYRALNMLSLRSGEPLFRWAGLLYAISVILVLAGVVLSLVLIGLLLLLIAVIAALASWIVLIIAFYQLKPPQPPQPQITAPAVPA